MQVILQVPVGPSCKGGMTSVNLLFRNSRKSESAEKIVYDKSQNPIFDETYLCQLILIDITIYCDAKIQYKIYAQFAEQNYPIIHYFVLFFYPIIAFLNYLKFRLHEQKY